MKSIDCNDSKIYYFDSVVFMYTVTINGLEDYEWIFVLCILLSIKNWNLNKCSFHLSAIDVLTILLKHAWNLKFIILLKTDVF